MEVIKVYARHLNGKFKVITLISHRFGSLMNHIHIPRMLLYGYIAGYFSGGSGVSLMANENFRIYIHIAKCNYMCNDWYDQST